MATETLQGELALECLADENVDVLIERSNRLGSVGVVTGW